VTKKNQKSIGTRQQASDPAFKSAIVKRVKGVKKKLKRRAPGFKGPRGQG